jgi:hypothetical protein
MNDPETYLWLGGWLEHSGRWHPPHCLASFTVTDAVHMAKAGPTTSGENVAGGPLCIFRWNC